MSATAPTSSSSVAAGRTGEREIAFTPPAAWAVVGKRANTVRRATGIGRIRTVAATITASVPSEPISSCVRSSPVTPLSDRWPVRSRVPSASTTSRARTDSRVTPYFAQWRPPAFVAKVPPRVEIAALAGSGA